MMYVASLLSDCLPLPPTPTHSMCAPGCFKTRHTRLMCSAAYRNIARFIGVLLPPLYSVRYSSSLAMIPVMSVTSSYSLSPPSASAVSSSPSSPPMKSQNMQCLSSSASTSPSPSWSRCAKSALKSCPNRFSVSSFRYARIQLRSSSSTRRS